MVIANLVFTMICFFILICFVRPNLKQTVSLISLYLFYPPIFLLVATSMSEMVNYGLISLFFMFFYLSCKTNSKNRRNIFLIFMILIGTICCFYRIIYIVLLFLPLLVFCKIKSFKFLVSSFIWLIYSTALFLINSLFTAPYPYGLLYNAMHSGSLKTCIRIFLHNTKTNIINLLNIQNGSHAEVFFRMMYLIMIFIYIILMIFKAEFKTKKTFLSIYFRNKIEKFYLMQFVLLIVPLCIVIIVYDVFSWRDFRTLAPFLWVSLLNLILFNRNLVIKFLIPIFILFVSANILFFPKLPGVESNTFCLKEDARYSELQEHDLTLINEVVKYDINAVDPFDNSITVANFDFYFWSKIDPAISIQFSTKSDNFKSKYVLRNTNTDLSGYKNKGKTDFGYLYVKD